MRGRPPTISEETILDAAKAVFVEEGVGATTAKIAERAGISESVLFHRYKTKEALFMAVMDRAMQVSPIAESLAGRVGKGDIADHLFEIGTAMVEDAKKTMPLFIAARMMAAASSGKLEDLQEKMKRPHPSQVRVMKLFAGYFEAEMDAGRLRQVDSEILARAFIGSVVQHVMSKFWGGTDPAGLPLSTPMFLRGLIDILLHGTLARP
ncbi:MAG TPA: TetR/AcrR family transcriptional regulator [Myxococcaceae bacterium]|nr:TetR/AcrR family transcriptional regulator [Myxococcaceae bacterium]